MFILLIRATDGCAKYGTVYILNIILYLVKKSFLHRVDLCYHFLLKSNNHVQKLSTIEEINVLVDREK